MCCAVSRLTLLRLVLNCLTATLSSKVLFAHYLGEYDKVAFFSTYDRPLRSTDTTLNLNEVALGNIWGSPLVRESWALQPRAGPIEL
jgi:hypothetical protein